MQESHWNHSFDMHLSYLGGYILTLSLLRYTKVWGKERGGEAAALTARGHPVSIPLSSFRFTLGQLECDAWGLKHPLFTDFGRQHFFVDIYLTSEELWVYSGLPLVVLIFLFPLGSKCCHPGLFWWNKGQLEGSLGSKPQEFPVWASHCW